jgi:ABC-type transport system involved in cytochrome bd biosynthesis fused ATPase/permease subunit
MYFLEISAANDFTFAFVVMVYGMGVLLAMCLVTGIIEWITENRERRKRRKRNKHRNRYIDIHTNWMYR